MVYIATMFLYLDAIAPCQMNGNQSFDQDLIYKIEDDCLRFVESFFRDASMEPRIFQMYRSRQILQEEGFMDVSELEGGLVGVVRYHIFSGIAENYQESFREYQAWRLPQGCFFKVLNVTVIEGNGLITLLQIPEYAIDYFALNQHPKEIELIEEAKSRFIEALKQEPFPARKDPYWQKRTTFPIGIAINDVFFYEYDYSAFPKLNPFYKRKNFFRRLFG